MIRILVVDDDRMARKGLILTVPWAEFGMEVVGEAVNGHAALAFLAQTPVDLVFTDLAMPLMTGIDLMQAAQRSHPGVRFVVLSFHQDFPSVQEALRLGALDYIAKQDLEREQIEPVLGRIRDRFVAQAAGVPGPAADGARRCPTDRGVAYLRTTAPGPFPLEASEILGPDLALVLGPEPPRPVAGWGAVVLTGLVHEPYAAVAADLARYRATGWFYDQDLAEPPVRSLGADDPGGPDPDATLEAFRTRLLDWDWVTTSDRAQDLIAQMRSARMAPVSLFSLLAVVRELWFRVYGHNAADSLPAPETRRSWAEVAAWLEGFRTNLRAETGRPPHPPHIQAAVLKAIRLIHTGYDRPLAIDEVADQVHLSRSHFSECFRHVTGRTFHDALRAARMDKAKELLATTGHPVYRVGELVGYQDEKYFSRQFKEAFGVGPQQYRKQQAGG